MKTITTAYFLSPGPSRQDQRDKNHQHHHHLRLARPDSQTVGQDYQEAGAHVPIQKLDWEGHNMRLGLIFTCMMRSKFIGALKCFAFFLLPILFFSLFSLFIHLFSHLFVLSITFLSLVHSYSPDPSLSLYRSLPLPLSRSACLCVEAQFWSWRSAHGALVSWCVEMRWANSTSYAGTSDPHTPTLPYNASLYYSRLN